MLSDNIPRDIEVLGWCEVGSVLTSCGDCASLALAGHPSSDGITMKIPYVVDVFLLGWLKLNLILLVYQLRLVEGDDCWS